MTLFALVGPPLIIPLSSMPFFQISILPAAGAKNKLEHEHVYTQNCQRKNSDCCWISSSLLVVCQLLNLYFYRHWNTARVLIQLIGMLLDVSSRSWLISITMYKTGKFLAACQLAVLHSVQNGGWIKCEKDSSRSSLKEYLSIEAAGQFL